MKHFLLISILPFLLPAAADAQDYSGYVPPSDSLVAEKLEHWQDLKFGVIFHWGLYSIPGIVESWSICSEDVDWINRSRDLGYEEYKQWYWGLKDRFDPASFDPEEWAEIMEDQSAGRQDAPRCFRKSSRIPHTGRFSDSASS